MDEYLLLKQPHDYRDIDRSSIFGKYFQEPTDIQPYLDASSNTNYLYWDKAKYLPPINGFTPTESWFLIQQIRHLSSSQTPIMAANSQFFTFFRPAYADRLLREIDMKIGGQFLTEKTASEQNADRRRYLTRGIMEESIASSQLEGADTSRRYAKKMLTEHIKPRTKSEHMILNNYEALTKVEEIYKKQPLSLFMLQELQSELVKNTLDPAYNPGEFRKDSDEIVVYYDNKIAHTPPSATFVQTELQRLINYANDTEFVHPIIKAIQLHFWIGYLHPFPDGNGRLARTIFYWYLLRNDYWGVAYVPISTVIKRSPHDYTYAYVYAEQDSYDFTYFFDYIVKRIIKAINEFDNYVNRKSTENLALISRIKNIAPNLNERQIQAIRYLSQNANNYTTPSSYSKLFSVTRKTASNDLHLLQQLDLVTSRRNGNKIEFYGKLPIDYP